MGQQSVCSEAVRVTIIAAAVDQAKQTRAAVRLPMGSRTRMVLAVTDTAGNVLGLHRMDDATVLRAANAYMTE